MNGYTDRNPPAARSICGGERMVAGCLVVKNAAKKRKFIFALPHVSLGVVFPGCSKGGVPSRALFCWHLCPIPWLIALMTTQMGCFLRLAKPALLLSALSAAQRCLEERQSASCVR